MDRGSGFYMQRKEGKDGGTRMEKWDRRLAFHHITSPRRQQPA